MRKLYLVPIVHTNVDMGSLSSALNEVSKLELGEKVWQKYKDEISSLWNYIEQFFGHLDVKGFKIYQDGMVANGADGLRIVREGISQGSRNYEIVGKLLERGAVLEKTEDLTLVRQEYNYIEKITRSNSHKEREVWALRYKRARDHLLTQRDDFIVKRIEETLKDGETGILFIGVHHNILSKLPSDIQVTQVVDTKWPP
jgi:hypothetical protein